MRYLLISLFLFLFTILVFNERQYGQSAVVIENPNSSVTRVWGITTCGDYFFQLTVTDTNGIIDRDTVKITVSCPPLPVKLESFTAKAIPTHNNITWTTSSESNIEKYILLCSQDGSLYVPIATIKAKNLTSKVIYNVAHNNPYPISLYRLRIVDLDGTSTLSSIVSVKREQRTRLNVVSGNYGTIVITIESKLSTGAILKIVDSKGVEVVSYRIRLSTGVNTIYKNVSNLPVGIYNAVLVLPNETITKRILLK